MRLDPQLAEQPLEAPSRSLAWRYALTLGTVAALSIGGQVIVHGALQDEATRAHVLNLAGRQRMLGERLGKTALALRAAHSSPADLAEQYPRFFWAKVEPFIGSKRRCAATWVSASTASRRTMSTNTTWPRVGCVLKSLLPRTDAGIRWSSSSVARLSHISA